MKGKEDIVIYKNSNSITEIEVKLANDSVWLSLNQMGDLFGRDKSVISKHLSNIFKEKELERDSVVANSATTAADGKTYKVDHFNLDVIISVGYRVKSKQGTQFRIWANKILKDYLTKGYALDKRRLEDQTRQLEELKQTVKLLGHVVESKLLNTDEATGLLKVLTDYSYALDVLDRYDHQILEIEATSPRSPFRITKTSIPVVKKRPHTCSTSSSRTTPSPMATSA